MNLPEPVVKSKGEAPFRLTHDHYLKFSKVYRSEDSLNKVEIRIRDFSGDTAIAIDDAYYLDNFYYAWKASYLYDSAQTLFKGVDTVGTIRVAWFVTHGVKNEIKKTYLAIYFFSQRVLHEILIEDFNLYLTREGVKNCIIKSIKLL